MRPASVEFTTYEESVAEALGGAQLDPPANRILAGFDAREIDRTAAGFLGLDWREIPHLAGEWNPGLLESASG